MLLLLHCIFITACLGLLPVTDAVPASVLCQRPHSRNAPYIYTGDVTEARTGEYLTVECKKKYLKVFPKITCIDGQWSQPAPRCIPVYCPTPLFSEGVQMKGSCQEYNCSLTFHCSEGFRYTGAAERYCQRNEQWNGLPGECKAVHCLEIPDLPHGKIYQWNRTFQSKAVVQCDDGYIFSDPNSTTKICQADGTWSGNTGTCDPIECPELPRLSHGRILQLNRTYKTWATVHCDEGYVYSSPDETRRQCEASGRWSGENGTCQEITCPSIHEEKHGLVVSNGKIYNEVVVLQCNSGYILDGPAKITCQADGNWSSKLGTCRSPENMQTTALITTLPIVCAIILSVVFGLVICHRRRKMKRGHDNEESVGLIDMKPLYCSFMLDESFEREFSEKGSAEFLLFGTTITKAVKSIIEKKLNLDVNLSVTSLCKMKKTVFIEIYPQQALNEKDIELTLEELTISNGKDYYHIIPNTIKFRDKVRHLLVADIYEKKHVTDKVYDKTIDLDKQYVQLKLITNKQMDAMHLVNLGRPDHYQRQLEEHDGSDIKDEDLVTEGDCQKYVLLRGRAGIGKSTLVQKLIWKWAKDEWAINFRAFFLINVRYMMTIDKSMDLSSLLSHFATYNTGNSSNPIDATWLQENQCNIGFIMDGIDEIKNFNDRWGVGKSMKDIKETAKPIDWCFALMNRYILQKSTLIVSSRPFKDLSLIESTFGKQQDTFMLVELMGLTKGGVIEFVEKNVDGNRKDFVQNTLKENPILLSVSSITFYCAALCWVLVDTNGNNEILSKLKTYTQITAYIMHMYMQRSMGADDEMSEETKSCLQWLSKLALKGLNLGESGLPQLVFEKKEVDKVSTRMDSSEVLRTGLLMQTELQNPRNPKQKQVLSQFVHLSIQEFLAMGRLMTLNVNTLEKSLKDLVESEQYNMALLFIYGMAFNSQHKEINILSNAVSGSTSQNADRIHILTTAVAKISNDMQALQIAHESQSIEIAKEIAMNKFPDNVSIKGSKLTIIDIIALLFVLRNSSSIHTIELEHVGLDKVSVQELAKGLEQNKTVRTLKLYDEMFDDQCTEAFMHDIQGNTSIESLEIVSDEMTDKGLYQIALFLRSENAVQCLTLDCKLATDKGISNLAKAISLNCRLKYLDLSCPRMTGVGATEVLNAINSEGSSVSDLSLFYKDMAEDHAQQFASALRNNAKLTTLSLDCRGLGDTGLGHVSSALGTNTTLRKLMIKCTEITDVGVLQVAKMLGQNSTIEEMGLLGFYIQKRGVDSLLEALKTNARVHMSIWKPDFTWLSSSTKEQLENHTRIKRQ